MKRFKMILAAEVAFDGWCEQATVRWDGTAFAEAE